jgi:hypothetical protein
LQIVDLEILYEAASNHPKLTIYGGGIDRTTSCKDREYCSLDTGRNPQTVTKISKKIVIQKALGFYSKGFF